MAKHKLRKDETSRRIRAFNIAVALLELNGKCGPEITNRKLRGMIRNQMGLPVPTGEAANGDLRASGDALGGHELKLENRRTAKDRFIKFTPANMARCEEYIKDFDADPEPSLAGLGVV